MSKLRDFIVRQRDELRGKMEPVALRCTELRSALTEEEQTLKAMQREWAELEQALAAINAAEESERRKPKVRIKEAVLTVLADHPTGLTSQEILREINTRYYEGKLKRESLSPQLTRLRYDDKKVILRGSHWIRKTENEAGLHL